MRAVEPWVEPPLGEFLRESAAHLVLLMTSSGQVVAQHGFTRSVDVMACAALGAAIVASTGELWRVMEVEGGRTKADRGGQVAEESGHVVHQGGARRVLLAPFAMPTGRWIGLIVFDAETSIGLVQVFFGRLAAALHAAAPTPTVSPALLAEQFEEELNTSLRSLFGR